jgi:hypothetical protein
MMVVVAIAALVISLGAVMVVSAAADLTDDTVAQFGQGTLGTGCFVASDASDGDVNGAVTLAEVYSTFPGSSFPSGWYSTNYGDGTATLSVSGSNLSINRYAVGYYAGGTTPYGNGTGVRVIEFRASFTGDSQWLGLAFDLDLNGDPPWALFHTSGGNLYAFSNDNHMLSNNEQVVTPTPVGVHTYRIEWGQTSIVYKVDGSIVATHTSWDNTSVQMHPIMVDYVNDSSSLSVDWVWMGFDNTTLPRTCTFTSRVLDGGVAGIDWQTLIDTANLPAGTSVAFRTRSGDVLDPSDPSWSGWTDVMAGAVASPNSRYIQYEATLSTTDQTVRPDLQQVKITGQTPTAVTLTNLSAQANGLSSAPLLLAASLVGLGVIGAALIKRRR